MKANSIPIRHAIVFVGMVSVLALLSGCSKQEAPQAQPPPGPPSQAAQVQQPRPSVPTAFQASLPQEGGPAGYAGSSSCRACHEDQHSSWHRSYHRTMTQFASPESIKADFNNVVLTNETTRFLLSRTNSEFWVRMEKWLEQDESGRAPALNTRVGLITGSHHMQVFWIPGGAGNAQIGFPFTWLIPEKRWVPREMTFVRPPGIPNQSEIWNMVCSRCHATAIEPRANLAERRLETRAAELGISCEACHGPAEKHVAARNLAKRNASAGPAKLLPNEIVHPEKIPATRSGQICGFCHSMKWFDHSEGWRDHGFRYRPGDDLEATTPIIRFSTMNSVAGLKDYLSANPEIVRDFFWPDGMMRVSGREYNGLLESPCHKGGNFSCLSCHSLHDSKPENQLAQKGMGNQACLQCHDAFKTEAKLISHTRHQPSSSGSECYNCHMPYTTYGLLKAIRSHHISSPRVADDLATGRPNACNLCHLDKSLGWTSEKLSTWFNQPTPPLDNAIRPLPRALNGGVTGDAGQRALIAWHLSWGPALEASGTNWVVPILGHLLEDPYPAVRAIAERSLRRFPNVDLSGYDYTRQPESRPEARSRIWKSWSEHPTNTAMPEPVRDFLRIQDGQPSKTAVDEWVRARDDRPVRLRE